MSDNFSANSRQRSARKPSLPSMLRGNPTTIAVARCVSAACATAETVFSIPPERNVPMPDAKNREGSETASPVRTSPKSTPKIRPCVAARSVKAVCSSAMYPPSFARHRCARTSAAERGSSISSRVVKFFKRTTPLASSSPPTVNVCVKPPLTAYSNCFPYFFTPR